MRRNTLIMLAMLVSVSFAGTAMAGTVNFLDDDISFPGYYNSSYPNDEYGTPNVNSMDVTWNDTTGNLQTIVINLSTTTRQLFDSLFINTDYGDGDTDWEGWDYFVHTGGANHAADTAGTLPGDGLWSVGSTYDYTTTASGGRNGHPNGIDANSLTFVDGMTGQHNDYTITYDFSGLGINVGPTFAVAYSPWCANDLLVGANDVPEPATMLLFGTGLAGLAGWRSRRKK